jgi:hypothetical protein
MRRCGFLATLVFLPGLVRAEAPPPAQQPRLVAQYGHSSFGFRAAVGDVHLSADGKRVLTVGADRTLGSDCACLWDAETGLELDRFKGSTDTIAAARAIEKITDRRSVPGSQVRALERVKDATGLHILAGCAADAVSYEASRYGQGLLTYSLLLGMKGAALREEQYVDVGKLFGFAADKVPELAGVIGGIQKPVIASPRGTPFDIGRLTEAERKRIVVASPRPLVLRALVTEEARVRDGLGLGKRLNERLRDVASDRGAALVFVDASEFPGAIEVGVRYKAGDRVTGTVTLFAGEKELAAFRVEGDKDKLDELAERIVAEIEKRLAGP